jgi:membrane-associated phospholipid phosphatase
VKSRSSASVILSEAKNLLLIAVAAASTLSAPLGAQVEQETPARPLFTWRDGVLGGVFVGATFAIFPLDKAAATTFQGEIPQGTQVFHKAAFGLNNIAVPGAVVIGASMYAIGRLSKDDKLARLGLHGTEALFIGEGIAVAMKYVFGRARPYADSVPNPDNWQLLRGFRSDSRYRSFPSGHTVAGFAAAAAVTAETSQWWPDLVWIIGPTLYGGAALVGLARMYDNRHWASDVIMGAAIGTFAGNKVVRYHRTHPNTSVDRWLLNVNVKPGDWSSLTLSVMPTRR